MKNNSNLKDKKNGVYIILTSFSVSILILGSIFLFLIKNDNKENSISDENIEKEVVLHKEEKNIKIESTSSQPIQSESNEKKIIVEQAGTPKTQEEFEKSIQVTDEELSKANSSSSSSNNTSSTTGDIIY